MNYTCNSLKRIIKDKSIVVMPVEKYYSIVITKKMIILRNAANESQGI